MDTETGMYYLMSRYYDPVTHRFLNADGYFQTGTSVLEANMNIYCGNNPVNYVDPSGNVPEAISGVTELILATAAILFIVSVNIVLALSTQHISSKSFTWGGNWSSGSSNSATSTTSGKYNWSTGTVSGRYNWNASAKSNDSADAQAKDLAPAISTVSEKEHKVKFPVNPYDFNPVGLKMVPRRGSKNGPIISWMDTATNTEIFRWDSNINYSNGPHYHAKGVEGHLYGGKDYVPFPYNYIYFPMT